MTGEPFEVHAQRGMTAFLGILGVGMTALSALPIILFWQGDMEALIMLPIGAIGVVFFGVATLTAMYRLLSPKPILRVDEEGIHVWRYPSLSWDEFDFADAGSSSGEAFLVIHTHDDDAYRARMVWYRRLWAKGNAALVEGAVYLSQRLVPGSAQDLAARINRAGGRLW